MKKLFYAFAKGKEWVLAVLLIAVSVFLHVFTLVFMPDLARFGWNPLAIIQKFVMAGGGLFLAVWLTKIASYMSIGFYHEIETKWASYTSYQRFWASIILLSSFLITFGLIVAAF